MRESKTEEDPKIKDVPELKEALESGCVIVQVVVVEEKMR